MNWSNFLTFESNPSDAFEIFCNQLFGRYLIRTYGKKLEKIRIVNGAAGDGGIEAYGQLNDGKIIAVQSKWFRDSMKDGQFSQIRNSITTAMDLRPKIINYIICIPRDISSLKYGRGKKGESKKPVENHEDNDVENLNEEMKVLFPELEITWWFEHDINLELTEPQNEGIQKFWFEKEVISLKNLQRVFEMGKIGWMHARYIPELHAQGLINDTVQELKFTNEFRNSFQSQLMIHFHHLNNGIKAVEEFKSSDLSTSIINEQLDVFLNNLKMECSNLDHILEALEAGNDQFYPEIIKAFDTVSISNQLRNIKPRNGQYGSLGKLLDVINNYEKYKNLKVSQYFSASILASF